MVTNPQDHPRFQAVFVGRTPSVTALALRDVVVAFCPMEDFSTTSSSATQLLLFKVCVNRRKSRLVLVLCQTSDLGFACIRLRSRRHRAVSGHHSALYPSPPERFVFSLSIAPHSPSNSGGRGQGEGEYGKTLGQRTGGSVEPR